MSKSRYQKRKGKVIKTWGGEKLKRQIKLFLTPFQLNVGCSSIGRASACGADGCEFKSRQSTNKKINERII